MSLARCDMVLSVVIQSQQLRLGEFGSHAAKGRLQHYLPSTDINQISGFQYYYLNLAHVAVMNCARQTAVPFDSYG